MANDIYDAAALTAGATTTVTITDDGTGIDWLVLPPGPFDNDYATFRLEWWVTDAVSTQARVTFWIGAISYSLQVNGLIENVRGAISDDWVNGNEADNLIYGDTARTGAGGNDTLGGDYGRDTIYGGAGNDAINSAYDDDLLYGDAGDDALTGGGGSDTLQGGTGADSLYGGADGSDWISYSDSDAGVSVALIAGDTSAPSRGGDAAGDLVNGVNNIIGSAFADTLRDSPQSNAFNANIFKGMAGNDRLHMGGNQDKAYGGAGADLIWGEDGADSLFGGAGNDSLRGGEGADVVEGGAGADRFVFAAATDSSNAPDGRDRIADFRRAQGDLIDLRLIDAKANGGADDAFRFIGAHDFGGTRGELRWLTAGSDVILRADLNGDGRADFSILIEDVARLGAADLLL